jgi:CBS domain-containing protein/anti-sigma regulatory factor (Ser/Thr protein kinase)
MVDDLVRPDDMGHKSVEITRQHELIYELRIEQVMTPRVLTLRPDDSLHDAKELLRINRISGAPVLEDGRIVGIVSVEDIVLALERQEISLPIRERMTGKVVSIRADESVVQAVNLFAKLRVGRLPVVDEEGNLTGIITRGDIVRGLLKAMDVDYRQEEISRHRSRHIFDDLVSDQTSVTLRYNVPSHDVARGGAASSQIKRALSRLGVDPRVARRAAIACYEAEMNIIIHADDGGEMIVEIQPDRLSIQAIDSGPGIEDVEQAMQAGFSTAPDWVRELGFGAGMGLNNIQTCADSLELDSGLGRGTRLGISILLEREI